VNLGQQENALEGANLAQVATEFSQAQVANEATLNATAKVLSLPNILDYLS
jgi:flagellin-like hook-associated protein FlgL